MPVRGVALTGRKAGTDENRVARRKGAGLRKLPETRRVWGGAVQGTVSHAPIVPQNERLKRKRRCYERTKRGRLGGCPRGNRSGNLEAASHGAADSRAHRAWKRWHSAERRS